MSEKWGSWEPSVPETVLWVWFLRDGQFEVINIWRRGGSHRYRACMYIHIVDKTFI